MDLNKERYIILEIIPTKVSGGDVAQLSALKINGIKLEDRFDYRLDKNKINVPDILNMTNYDNDSFKYVKTTKALMKNFKKFIVDNKKESIFKYLNLDMSDDVFDRLVNKYNLEASNYLVDLLYEAIIKEI